MKFREILFILCTLIVSEIHANALFENSTLANNIFQEFDSIPVGQTQPVNVVFIMTDNQGAWTHGCYGNPDIKT